MEEQNQKLKDEIKNLIKENEKLHHKNKQIEIKFKAQIQNMVKLVDKITNVYEINFSVCNNKGATPNCSSNALDTHYENEEDICYICEKRICNNCVNLTKCKSCGYIICKNCSFDEVIRKEYHDLNEIAKCTECTEHKYFWATY